MPEPRWTVAMRESWQYALEAAEMGLSGSAALRAFREGGGSIRTQDWYQLHRWAGEVIRSGEEAELYPRYRDLPESVFVSTDIDYREEFVVTAEVSWTDPATGRRVRRHITALDEYHKSLNDWISHLDVTLSRYGKSFADADVSLGRMWFMRRE